MPTDIQDALATLASARQSLASTADATAASALAELTLAETVSALEQDLQRIAADASERLAELDGRQERLLYALGRLARVTEPVPTAVVAGGSLATEVDEVAALLTAALGVDAAGLAVLQAVAANHDDALDNDVVAALAAVEAATGEHLAAVEDEQEAGELLREVEEELSALGGEIGDRYRAALERVADARRAHAAGEHGAAFVAWDDARRALATLASATLDLDADQLAAAALDQPTIDGGATPLGDQAQAQWQAARDAYEAAFEVRVEKQIALIDARLALARARAAHEVAVATRDEDLAAKIEAEVAGGGP